MSASNVKSLFSVVSVCLLGEGVLIPKLTMLTVWVHYEPLNGV